MVTIQLQENVAAALNAKALSEGLSLEAFLSRLATERSQKSATPLSADELDALLDAESSEQSTYRGSYSRADIYREHA